MDLVDSVEHFWVCGYGGWGEEESAPRRHDGIEVGLVAIRRRQIARLRVMEMSGNLLVN